MATKKVSPKSSSVVRHTVSGSLVTVAPGDGGAVTAPKIRGRLVLWAGDAGLVGLSASDERQVFARALDVMDRFKAIPGNVRVFDAGPERFVIAGDAQYTLASGQWWRLRWVDASSGADVAVVECADVRNVCAVGDRLVVLTRAVREDEIVRNARSTPEGTVWEDQPLREVYANVENGFFGDGAALVFSLADAKPLGRVTIDAGGDVFGAHGLREHVVLNVFDAESGGLKTRAHRVSDGGLAWGRSGSPTAVGDGVVIVRDGDRLVCVGEDGGERWDVAWLESAALQVTIGAGVVVLVGDGTKERPSLSYKQALTVSAPIEVRDIASGEVRWSLESGVNRVASVDDRHVWTHDPKDELVALALATGAEATRLREKGADDVATGDGVCAFLKRKKAACDLFVHAVPAS